MYTDIEIRKLPCGALSKIINILETNGDWQKFMSKIPKHPQSSEFEPKYNSEHICLIEEHSHTSGRKCSEILFEEWGTSGRIRPTLSTLKDIFLKCEMYRAADAVAQMLNEAPPRRPSDGPAASIDTDVSMILNNESIEQKLDAMASIDSKNMSVNTYSNINNGTTAQMKSASDFIKFSTSQNTPNMSIFTPSEKKPVTKTDSDLIKFSQTAIALDDMPNVSALTPTENQSIVRIKSHSDLVCAHFTSLDSEDMPKVSALLNAEDIAMKINIPIINVSDTELTMSSDVESSQISMTQNSISQEHGSQNSMSESVVYQTTFPNIELSQSLSQSRILTDIIVDSTDLTNFKYSELEHITNNFSEQINVGPLGISGKIGMGGFGEVFVGVHPSFGTLAVKKTHNELLNDRKCGITIKLFNAEVKYLSQFRHENIVPILGYSIDGPAPCIVCEFIDGGSLERKIAAKVLSEKQRINIIVGTAEGLKYLHKSQSYTPENAMKTNFVHGDVKSANILLTKDYVPKLCDFGLAKQSKDTTFVTTSPMGTSSYMAPEGFSGTITQKMDIYSFGIVMLELLTGLKSLIIDDNNDQINLKLYVEENSENGDITNLLDSAVPNWTKANEVYKLANACLHNDRKKRYAIEDVCEILDTIKIG